MNNNLDVADFILNGLNGVNRELSYINILLVNELAKDPENKNLAEVIKRLSESRVDLTHHIVGVAENVESKNKAGNIDAARMIAREVATEDMELYTRLKTIVPPTEMERAFK